MADDFILSSLGRLLQVGGVAGRLGIAAVSSGIQHLWSGKEGIQLSVASAEKISQILIRLRGAPMKMGQLLSAQDWIFPPEVAPILTLLQATATPRPFSEMKKVIDTELPHAYERIATIDEIAMRSASVAQVHIATLKTGEKIVLKMQYPGMETMLESDLRNLRFFLGSIFSIFTDIKMDPVFDEVEERLREEIDFNKEQQNLQKAAEVFAVFPEVVIPRVIPELSSSHILALSYEDGLTIDEAKLESEDLRAKWGKRIFEFQSRCFFDLLLLHADPNPANFAFRKDGSIVVYDFGCVKVVPPKIAETYANVAQNTLGGRSDENPLLLKGIGIRWTNGQPLDVEFLRPYANLLLQIFPEGDTVFGSDPSIQQKIWELFWRDLLDSSKIQFPADLLFIHRTMVGHYGNLSKLKAKGNWRKELDEFTRRDLPMV